MVPDFSVYFDSNPLAVLPYLPLPALPPNPHWLHDMPCVSPTYELSPDCMSEVKSDKVTDPASSTSHMIRIYEQVRKILNETNGRYKFMWISLGGT